MNKQKPYHPNHQVKLLRVDQSLRSTLSHLYLDGLFLCYILEDALQKEKIEGQTAIPEGTYQLQLNTRGGMNRKYALRFPEFHRGMLEVVGIPDFRYVYLHIGNTPSDTEGCLLSGHYWQQHPKGDFRMVSSAFAYRLVYPKLLKAALEGPLPFQVENQSHLNLHSHDT